MNTLALEDETANGSTPIEKMPDKWLQLMLLDGLRGGKCGVKGDHDWKMTMAFACAVSREETGKGKGPSVKVRNLARQVYRGFRYATADEPIDLIDLGDNPECDEMDLNHAEF